MLYFLEILIFPYSCVLIFLDILHILNKTWCFSYK